jgi:anti-sigma factor RsiW
MHEHQCDHLLGELSDYLDGEVSDAICAEIERHLGDCEKCRVVVDTLRKTVELVHDLPGPDLPEGARQRLYHTLDLSDWLSER